MLSVLAGLVLQVAAASRPPVTSAAAPASDSTRSANELRAASQRYANAVRGCYEREGLKADPSLAGTLDVSITIIPQGQVREVKVDTLDVRGVGMREVASCVSTLATQWHFSSGAYAVEETTFTFKLLPPGLPPDSASKPRI